MGKVIGDRLIASRKKSRGFSSSLLIPGPRMCNVFPCLFHPFPSRLRKESGVLFFYRVWFLTFCHYRRRRDSHFSSRRLRRRFFFLSLPHCASNPFGRWTCTFCLNTLADLSRCLFGLLSLLPYFLYSSPFRRSCMKDCHCRTIYAVGMLRLFFSSRLLPFSTALFLLLFSCLSITRARTWPFAVFQMPEFLRLFFSS